MTWQHVACVAIAAGLVILALFVCGNRSECGPIISNIVTLATIIISGSMGNAGIFRNKAEARYSAKEKPLTEADYVSGVGPK